MQLLQRFLKKNSLAPGIVAVSFLPNGFAIAVTNYDEQNRPRLLHCEFAHSAPQQLLPQLEMLVKEYELNQYDCHILLTPEQYRLIGIDAPAVTSEEMRSSIKWRIAEMLDYPVDQAVIDFYHLPKSNRANSSQLLEVVACPQQIISGLTQQCTEAGFKVKIIDIQETALRNLATLLRENEQGVALLHIQKEGGCIIIQKQGELFLSRKISSGAFLLDADSTTKQGELFKMELDSLALEIQRSFDYVENYYSIPPITSLAMVLMPANTPDVINFLNTNHGITARVMDLSAIIDGDILLDDHTQNVCAAVIGASLRRFLEPV
ncbi:MAG: pilus assembly protein PilM [Methylomonas sp.]